MVLKSHGITQKVNNDLELSAEIIKNFESPIIKNQKQIDFLNSYGDKILKETALELNAYLK